MPVKITQLTAGVQNAHRRYQHPADRGRRTQYISQILGRLQTLAGGIGVGTYQGIAHGNNEYQGLFVGH